MMVTNSKPDFEIATLYSILKYTFGVVPIVAGLDKFLNLLTSWELYLSPTLTGLLPIEAGAFLKVAGVIEVAAGALVIIKTRFGAYLVAGWLVLIALSLVLSGQHLDVAVRDLVMAIGAYTLARLSVILDK